MKDTREIENAVRKAIESVMLRKWKWSHETKELHNENLFHYC